MVIIVVLAGVEVLVVLIFVVHGVVALSLGLFNSLGEVDALATSTAAGVNDVGGRDGLEVSLIVVFLFYRST